MHAGKGIPHSFEHSIFSLSSLYDILKVKNAYSQIDIPPHGVQIYWRHAVAQFFVTTNRKVAGSISDSANRIFH